jgi:hypothetical protein
MKIFLSLAIVGLLLVLWRPTVGFRWQTPEHYSDTAPGFDIKKHLGGNMVSDGVIYGPTGRVVTRFVADMEGVWDGETGTLSEFFSYAGGGGIERKWFLEMGENGTFTATADDIIGVATGVQSGATVQLKYKLKLAEDAGGHILDVVDWLYLMENGTIINRSQMRKFGIKVAELVASIRPVE